MVKIKTVLLFFFRRQTRTRYFCTVDRLSHQTGKFRTINFLFTLNIGNVGNSLVFIITQRFFICLLVHYLHNYQSWQFEGRVIKYSYK